MKEGTGSNRGDLRLSHKALNPQHIHLDLEIQFLSGYSVVGSNPFA